MKKLNEGKSIYTSVLASASVIPATQSLHRVATKWDGN